VYTLHYTRILWHVDPLLGNDCEISSHKTAIAKQWLCKQRPLLGSARNRRTTIEELLEAVLSMRFVPGLYNDCQLPLEECLETAMRRIGGWCEMAVSLGVSGVECVDW
jgi:hypothetical protein